MKKLSSQKPLVQSIAIAVGSFGAGIGAVYASDVSSGLSQLEGNNADPAAVVQRRESPFTFRIPAAETEVILSGYVKADFFFDTGNDLGDSFAASAIPTDDSEEDGHFRAHARQSRLRIKTKTELENGKELEATIEGDFFGAGGNEIFSNSTSFRLRHAYFTVDRWTFGQTWTNFMDFIAYPTTVDFFGPAGKAFLRQAQIRYTLPNGLSFSLENPETDGDGGAGRLGESLGGLGRDLAPDATAAWRGGPGGIGGFYETAIVVRALGVGGDIDDEEFGVGINLAGGWDVGTGMLAASVTGGSGIGRYVINGGGNGLFVTDDGEVETVDALGATISYDHRWSEKANSLIAVGTFQNDNDFAANGIDSVTTVHINYRWSPTEVTTYGIEGIYGNNETADGESNDAGRFQFAAQLNF